MKQLNYFDDTHEALNRAFESAPETTLLLFDTDTITGFNACLEKLFVINYINNVMGWQIGFYVNNLAINKTFALN